MHWTEEINYNHLVILHSEVDEERSIRRKAYMYMIQKHKHLTLTQQQQREIRGMYACWRGCGVWSGTPSVTDMFVIQATSQM